MLTLVLHVAFGCPDLGGGYPGVAPWPRTLLLAPTVWGGWGEVVDRVRSTRALMVRVAPYIRALEGSQYGFNGAGASPVHPGLVSTDSGGRDVVRGPPPTGMSSGGVAAVRARLLEEGCCEGAIGEKWAARSRATA